jgi:hypothetical protein
VLLVNYYPCSYGDTLVAMFSDNGHVRNTHGFIRAPASELKEPDFYKLTRAAQLAHWQELQLCQVLSCHRQQGFDFNLLGPVRVVSVIVNDRKWLHCRVEKHHLGFRGLNFNQDWLRKLHNKLNNNVVHQIIEADYRKWLYANVLDTDLVINFEEMLNKEYFSKWCQLNNLQYNSTYIDDIKSDLKKYNDIVS